MMKRKSILISAIACLFVLAVGVGGSLAWLSDTDSAKNEFTIGNVEIKVDEDWNPSDGQNVAPGETITKKPRVQNTGDNACYIRVKVVANPDEDYYELDGLNENNWEKVGDYYYYVAGNGIVQPNSYTSYLFTGVTLNNKILEPDFANAGFDINVYAEAIQSDNAKLGTAGTLGQKIADLFGSYNTTDKNTIPAPVKPE